MGCSPLETPDKDPHGSCPHNGTADGRIESTDQGGYDFTNFLPAPPPILQDFTAASDIQLGQDTQLSSPLGAASAHDFPPAVSRNPLEDSLVTWTPGQRSEQFRDKRRFWEGENTEKFGTLKQLIDHYKTVRGMKTLVERLAGAWLRGDQPGFRGAAGELLVMHRLVEFLSPEYKVEVLGVGLLAGYREIDAFLKIQSVSSDSHGESLRLQNGFYTLEVKSGNYARYAIEPCIASQVTKQIDSACLFEQAGIPYRGAILAVGSRSMQSIKEETSYASKAVYSFHAGPLTLDEAQASFTQPAPTDEDFEYWLTSRTDVWSVFREVLIPAFHLSVDEETPHADAIHQLSNIQKQVMNIRGEKMQMRTEPSLERLRHERRKAEADGWCRYFTDGGIEEPGAEPKGIEVALHTYFARNDLSVEELRQNLITKILERSSEPAMESPTDDDRKEAWKWVIQQCSLYPLHTVAHHPARNTPKANKSVANAIRPRGTATPESEGSGFADAFMQPGRMTIPDGMDEDTVKLIFIKFFRLRESAGQPVPKARIELQTEIQKSGFESAWQKIFSVVQTPVDTPEIRPAHIECTEDGQT